MADIYPVGIAAQGRVVWFAWVSDEYDYVLSKTGGLCQPAVGRGSITKSLPARGLWTGKVNRYLTLSH